MASPKISFYTPQELETFAEVFLEKFHKPADSLPVEIDTIVEADLDIRILPFSCLEQNYGLHGYLALSLKKIYIDQYIMDEDNFERRYRFTIAEEVAHSLLHKDLFKDVKTPKEYLDALDKISESAHAQMDIDAKRLAEAILMPAVLFRKESLRIATEIGKNNKTGKSSLFSKLADKFNVSIEAVGYRFRHLGLATQIVL
ncbi:MAG: ImmA/IrrE family metallo-endopeptidase [Candidatus Omnitrophota bacterium]